jgi:hypothetical protein
LLAENISINEERARDAVLACLVARENREGIFKRDLIIPEANFISRLRDMAVRIGDPRLPLNALFCVLPCVFAQKTTGFFKQIEKPEVLEQAYWLFQPERVVQAINAGVNVEQEYLNFFHRGKFYRKAVAGITYNSQVLAHGYDSDIRSFFEKHKNDAVQIVKALEIRNRARTGEKEMLRYGPKLSRFLIQLVSQYKMADLTNSDKIGLPVDMQLARFLIQTGAVSIDGSANAFQVVSNTVQPLLMALCEQNMWNPQQVSETIWLVGSNCCTYKKHELCPAKDLCDTSMPSTIYYRSGKFTQGEKR